MKGNHGRRCRFCPHRCRRPRSSLLELSDVLTTIETFALTWKLSLCLTLEVELTQLEELSGRRDVWILVPLIARFESWFDNWLIDFDIIENFEWLFCKIVRHVEVEVNIALPWILTLLPSFISTVSALRLKKSQTFDVTVAAIGSSLVGSVGFGILDKGLCFTGGCATPSRSWDFSEADEAAQTLERRRKLSMSKNSSLNRAWLIFSSERDVFFSVSNERLRGFSKGSMNERQRSSSLVVPLSPPPRLFSALSEFSAFIRWISHDAGFQKYLHPRLWFLQPFCIEAEIRFRDSSWTACFTGRAVRLHCVFHQHYPKLVALGWGLESSPAVVDKSWCETCQRQPLQKIIARESYKQEDSGNGCLFHRRAQDGLYVMAHQPLSAQRHAQSHCEPHNLCAVSLKLRKLSLGCTQPSRVAQPSTIPVSPSLFSCRPIHALCFSRRCASGDLQWSSQLDRRWSPWIKHHRTPRRTPRETLGRAQAARVFPFRANRRWFTNSLWLDIGTTETISFMSWGIFDADGKDEGCSAKWHRTAQENVTSSTAQVPIQAVLRSAHAYSLNQAAATSASTDAWNSAELNSMKLPNCRKPGFGRRCHQTAANSITPFIRRRHSRKHAQGDVRHLFNWSRRTGDSSEQASPCLRPCRGDGDRSTPREQ